MKDFPRMIQAVFGSMIWKVTNFFNLTRSCLSNLFFFWTQGDVEVGKSEAQRYDEPAKTIPVRRDCHCGMFQPE